MLGDIWLLIFLSIRVLLIVYMTILVLLLFRSISYLLHDIHKSLTQSRIVLNQQIIFFIFLSYRIVTFSLIFLYWISSDYISIIAISMVLICNLLFVVFLSNFNFFIYLCKVISQLPISSLKACWDTKWISVMAVYII